MQEYGTLIMMRGGDKNFRLYFPGEDDQPMNLTDFTVEAFEPHRLLENNISLTIEDPTSGAVVGSIAWDDDYVLGSTMTFYVQLRESTTLVSAPKLIVRVI